MKKGIKYIIASIILTIVGFFMGAINITYPQALCIDKELVQTEDQNGNKAPYYLYTFSFERGNNEENGIAYYYSSDDYTVGSYEEYSKVYLVRDNIYEIVLDSIKPFNVAMKAVSGIALFGANVLFIIGVFMLVFGGVNLNVKRQFSDIQRTNFYYTLKENNKENDKNINNDDMTDGKVISDDDNPIK